MWVGVGDVGQLPPIEVGTNPWRGDPGHNPWRAWPTDYDDDRLTWSAELPAVHRPAAGHLGLWRAFYPDWDELHCVAAPGDRRAELGDMPATSAAIWAQVATGVPTLLEVDGLPPADAADVDLPLVEFVESLLDDAVRRRVHAVLGDVRRRRRAERRSAHAVAGRHRREPARRDPRDAQPGGRRRRRRGRPAARRSTA